MKGPLILSGVLAAAAAVLHADESQLTGNWSGIRPKLADHGIEFSASYTGEVFGNPIGGVKRGVVYNGLAEIGLEIDLEKLVGWRGGRFHAGALFPHGESGTANFVGDIGTFSNIDSYDSVRLYEIWLEQSLFADRLSIRVGQLDIDSDFAGSECGSLFISSDFGNSPGCSLNIPEPTYATLAPGVRVKFDAGNGFAASFAVYDGNAATGLGDPSPNAAPSTDFNLHNTSWALRGSEGALLAGEISYAFNQPDEAAETDAGCGKGGSGKKTIVGPRPLGGIYKAGVFHHTDRFSKVADVQLTDLGSSLAPAEVGGAQGNTIFYVVADQEIWREPGSEGDGLALFARAMFASSDRNFARGAYEGGIVYRGLVQEGDQLGLGFAFIDISPRIAEATRATNRRDRTRFAVPDYEATLELTYQFQIKPWWTVQPDAQWIIHPGGSDEIDNALVIGVRTTLNF